MTQLAVLSLLVAAAAAAPVPKDKTPVYYAATKVGTKRVYGNADGKPTSVWATIKVEENPKGGLLVTEASADWGREPRPHRVLLVTEELVAILDGPRVGKPYDPPWVFVRPKAKAGDNWEFNLPLPVGILRPTQFPPPDYAYTARGGERIEVPAGTFDAVRVEESYLSPMPGAKRGTRTAWYAPGVGIIKSVVDTGVTSILQEITTAK